LIYRIENEITSSYGKTYANSNGRYKHVFIIFFVIEIVLLSRDGKYYQLVPEVACEKEVNPNANKFVLPWNEN